MEDIAYELNRRRARLAARGGRDRERADGRPRFVAGALGPTNRTASISPDVNDPGFRAVTFDELRAAYAEQARGLIDGGADLLLIETIFDTLNAKAAIFAIEELFDARRAAAGDDLRHHHRPLRPHAVRARQTPSVLAFGAPRRALDDRPQLRARRPGDARPYRRARARRRYAGLRLSQRRPAQRVRRLRREPRGTWRLLGEFAEAGLVNIVGGCCGTTPGAYPRHRRGGRRGSRAIPGRRRRSCGCPASSRSRSRRKFRSSTSASAPTSPARRSSAS